jgi:hypothetical protein
MRKSVVLLQKCRATLFCGKGNVRLSPDCYISIAFASGDKRDS